MEKHYANVVPSHSALQIHFDDEQHHWVLSSFSKGEVRLYDSLSSPKFTPLMEKQLLHVTRSRLCQYNRKAYVFVLSKFILLQDISSVAFDQKEFVV